MADPDQTISVNVPTAGEFTPLLSLPYNSEGTTILTINSIQKRPQRTVTYYPPNNNTAPLGLPVAQSFGKLDGNCQLSLFLAAVTEVTIQVFGNGLGGNTNSTTMNVIPGVRFIHCV